MDLSETVKKDLKTLTVDRLTDYLNAVFSETAPTQAAFNYIISNLMMHDTILYHHYFLFLLK